MDFYPHKSLMTVCHRQDAFKSLCITAVCKPLSPKILDPDGESPTDRLMKRFGFVVKEPNLCLAKEKFWDSVILTKTRS